MQTHKITKASARIAAIAMIDRGREEELLLERWAASDSARSVEESDWDDSLDGFDTASVAARPGYAFDA